MIIADDKVPRRNGFGESCSVERMCVCVCGVRSGAPKGMARGRGWVTTPSPHDDLTTRKCIYTKCSSHRYSIVCSIIVPTKM